MATARRGFAALASGAYPSRATTRRSSPRRRSPSTVAPSAAWATLAWAVAGRSCLRVGSAAGQPGEATTGRTTREADRSIVRYDGSIRVDVAGSSPVPRLRSQRGCEPPATVSRIRPPRGNRCAIGSSSNRTRSVGDDGSSRSIPSATFREATFGVDLREPDEQVGERVVGAMTHLRDRGAGTSSRRSTART